MTLEPQALLMLCMIVAGAVISHIRLESRVKNLEQNFTRESKAVRRAMARLARLLKLPLEERADMGEDEEFPDAGE